MDFWSSSEYWLDKEKYEKSNFLLSDNALFGLQKHPEGFKATFQI